MKVTTACLIRTFVFALLSGVAWVHTAYSAVIYSSSIIPGSTVNASADTFPSPLNCLGSEGCFYTGTNGTGTGILVDDVLFGGAMPASIPLKFHVSAAEKAAIASATSGTATLVVTASRDLGLRQQAGGGFAAPSEWLTVQIGGTDFGELFKNTQSTCPSTETAGTANCGPNFHTDIQATDSSSPMDKATLLSAIVNDPTFGDRIQIDLTPTAAVGRVKIFDATLTFVPEPSTYAVLALGVLLLGWRLRQLSARRP